ncbi:hypothetical protein THAOC_05267 [Thalassiosira oceanica]|uniref:CCHC-type domain-containing protein n=1 Tax=Thalassiosira oceanica TaxID=159749 RepID=K0T395_THAOC|nr:hypothetical protein THAOC_05267 [Thalassiosira oceanica]|eukprot:EJK73128.1 hypothetical protein THAOC_05267 [Thalassiosira oceanica]
MINDGVLADGNAGEKMKGGCLGDGSNWRVWAVIDELETNGLSASTPDEEFTTITSRVVCVLKQWANEFAGLQTWQSLLNKNALLHEVEESIVALHLFQTWLDKRNSKSPVTLVDVCCGKGITSLLASFLFRRELYQVVALDKNASINWHHIKAANMIAANGRPRIMIWGDTNLHEIDALVERLGAIGTTLAFIGIHLCKNLSPAAVGLANNLLGVCDFLLLAPCCLPRQARNYAKFKYGPVEGQRFASFVIPVRIHESEEDRKLRLEANARRANAKRRFANMPCILCDEIHPIKKCSLLPCDESERFEIFRRAEDLSPCWRCGELGHKKEQCQKGQDSAKPRLVLPPTVEMDVATIEKEKSLFEGYCNLLAKSIQLTDVKVIDVGMVNSAASLNNSANHDNWNAERKSIYIVAVASD